LSISTKRCQWRTALVAAVLLVNVTNAPVAAECFDKWYEYVTAGATCVVEKGIEFVGKHLGKGAVQGIKPAYQEMVNETGDTLVAAINSIDWEDIGRQAGQGASEAMLEALDSIDWTVYGQQVGAGLRQEFELLMDNLFDDQIKPLLQDIDMLLKQTNQMAEARITQVDKLIEQRLQQIDGLVQTTVTRFQTAANETIDKAKQELITYAFERAEQFREQTIAQIRTELIDYTTQNIQNLSNDIIDKIKQDLMAYSFERADSFREQTVAQIRTELIDYTAQTIQTVTNQSVAKIKNDLIAYSLERSETFRDQSLAKIKTELIDYGTDTIQKLTDETVKTLQTELIDRSFTKLENFHKDFRTDVNQFFDRTEYLIDKVDCQAQGTLEKIRLDMETTGKQLAEKIDELLPKWWHLNIFSKPAEPAPALACYRQLGLKTPPKPFQYSTIYDLKKCEVLNSLTPETPIRQILNVYLDLKALAARMACVQRSAGEQAILHYTWDWLEFGHQYDLWYSIQ